jgi:hypothetical protein
VGNGKEILETLIADLPAANAATLAAWNDHAREKYEAESGGDPGPFEPYTLDQQMTAEDMQFFEELPETLAGEHIFVAAWLACGQDSVKGWLYDSPTFTISLTSYELGGNELSYKVTTIKQCMFTSHMLVAEGFPTTTFESFMSDDDFDEVDVVGEVHNHHAELRETAMANIASLDNLLRLGDETLALGLLKLELEDNGDSSEAFDAARLFSELYVDGGAFFRNLCLDPEAFCPRVYATMGAWNAWADVVCQRNKLCHAAHVIQRWARCCLHDPQYKKGRKHVMQSRMRRRAGQDGRGPRHEVRERPHHLHAPRRRGEIQPGVGLKLGAL